MPDAAKSFVTKLEQEQYKMIKDNLGSDRTTRKMQQQLFKDMEKEKVRLREEAHRRTIDSGEEGGKSEEDNVQEDTSDGVDATCRSKTNPNSTVEKEIEVKVDNENDEGNAQEDASD